VVLADGKYNAWPSLAVDGSGKRWLAYSAGSNHFNAFDNVGKVKSSTDGISWSAATQLTPNAVAGTTRYSATGMLVTQTGRLIFTYWDETNTTNFPGQMHHRHSDDDGSTWSTAASLPGWSQRTFAGSQSLFQAAGGRIFCTIYGNDTGETVTNYKAGVVYSDDNGSSWSGPVLIGPANNALALNEASLTQKDNGDLVIFIRSEQANPDPVYRSISSDNGATWSTVFGLGLTVCPGSPTALRFGGTGGTEGGMILVHRQVGTIQNGSFNYTWDYGDHWSPETAVDSGLPFQYAGAAVLSPTKFAVCYAVNVDTSPDPGEADLKYIEFTVT
jgi:hypothetical protein